MNHVIVGPVGTRLAASATHGVHQGHDHHQRGQDHDIEYLHPGIETVNVPPQVMLDLSQLTADLQPAIHETLDFLLLGKTFAQDNGMGK